MQARGPVLRLCYGYTVCHTVDVNLVLVEDGPRGICTWASTWDDVVGYASGASSDTQISTQYA